MANDGLQALDRRVQTLGGEVALGQETASVEIWRDAVEKAGQRWEFHGEAPRAFPQANYVPARLGTKTGLNIEQCTALGLGRPNTGDAFPMGQSFKLHPSPCWSLKLRSLALQSEGQSSEGARLVWVQSDSCSQLLQSFLGGLMIEQDFSIEDVCSLLVSMNL
jgi:hypothetical protein